MEAEPDPGDPGSPSDLKSHSEKELDPGEERSEIDVVPVYVDSHWADVVLGEGLDLEDFM